MNAPAGEHGRGKKISRRKGLFQRFAAAPERFIVSVAKMNGATLDIQPFASFRALARGQQPRIRLERISMGLFKPDLYRAFFLGFGVTALVMAAQFVPHLI